MVLPVPNLDDRRFDDLLREARERIVKLCPAWTDFNPSDPGMTLVELMAWLTDLTLYRVNRIPQNSYAVFLNLMGVRLRPAEAARTWLLFEPQAGTGGGLLEPGTTAQALREGGPPLVFSTTEPLNLTPVRPVVALFTEGKARPRVFPGEAQGSLLRLLPAAAPMPLAGEERRAEHLLLLGNLPPAAGEPDPLLAAAPPGGLLHLEIGLAPGSTAGAEVEWERAAGGSATGEADPLHGGWRPWAPERDETLGLRRSGRISFRVTEPVFLRPHAGLGLWLRARLLESRPEGLPGFTGLAFRFELPPAVAPPPERVCLRSPQQLVTELPIPHPAPPGGKPAELEPFGAEPVAETALLIGSPLLERPGAEISVTISLRSDGPVAGAPPPELRWEISGADGRWIPLGHSTPEGASEPRQGGFTDDTRALTRSGTVGFRRPEGVGRVAVLGELNTFLRLRLVAGRPHRVFLNGIRIAFADLPTPFGAVLAENYGRLEQLEGPGPLRPFLVRPAEEAGPTLLIGLSDRPANALQRLFLDLRPPRRPAPPAGEGLRLFFAEEPPGPAAPRTLWSYSAGGDWKPLALEEDGTRDLALRGSIAFIAPPDWTPRREGEVEAHWLRVRLDPGRPAAERPALAAIATNCIEAVHAEPIWDTVLTTPLTEERWQRLELPLNPLLPGLALAIRELEAPSPDALAELRRQPGLLLEEQGAGAGRDAWVRWEEVPDFFRSGPDSRHYLFDPAEGTITFGDGRHGRIPPAGANRVRLLSALRGGGAAGNLAARTINQPLRSLEGVDRVYNPVPAEGGADAEPVEEALRRGPHALRHRERAVTAEDYERLAREASPAVARASCSTADGQVQVLIIPEDGTATPAPGRHLVETVRSYLERRRVIGTRLRVTGPDYVGIAVKMGVALRSTHVARMQEVRRQIEEALHRFVHPVHGGPDLFVRRREAPEARERPGAAEGEAGWPLGRTLHVSELYYVVELIRGVDYASEIELARAGEGWRRDKISLGPTSLPHFLRIEIGQVR